MCEQERFRWLRCLSRLRTRVTDDSDNAPKEAICRLVGVLMIPNAAPNRIPGGKKPSRERLVHSDLW